MAWWCAVSLSAVHAQEAVQPVASEESRASPSWTLQIEAPDSLKSLLSTYLDLAKGEASSEGELRRLVAASSEQARELLQARGYFAADVRVKMPERQPGQLQQVHMLVDPGPLTRIEKVQMLFEGDLDSRLSDEDPQAVALVDQLQAMWALPEGEVFTQERWSASKNATLAWLRAHGYPQATWSGTSSTVDAQAQTARLFLVADSGPALTYGPLKVEGLQHQPESAIRNLMSFKLGEPYREKQLLDFQERVQKLNLFESVFVTLGDTPVGDSRQAAVNVQVRELPLQQATLGVGVSSDTGPRVSVEHIHRLLWGFPWQAKSKLQIGRDESLIQSDLTSHPRPKGQRWLASIQASRQVDDDDAVTVSSRVRFGLSFESERVERTTYVELQRALVKSAASDALSEASAVTVMQQWLRRDLDNPVLPTTGFTANAYAGLGRSFSALDDSGWFMRAYGRVTWYRPLPSSWYLTLRTEAAQVVASDQVSVPDTLLYRAGGDESVRGYGYRTLGVKDGTTTLGGRSLLTGSAELAHPLVRSIPSLWGAVFVDMGDAAQSWSAMNLKLGYGAGVRWRSPVGPLRLDAAYGRDVRAYRLHFSVGIIL
jgi:translocation and assembly module TamA